MHAPVTAMCVTGRTKEPSYRPNTPPYQAFDTSEQVASQAIEAHANDAGQNEATVKNALPDVRRTCEIPEKRPDA